MNILQRKYEFKHIKEEKMKKHIYILDQKPRESIKKCVLEKFDVIQI